MSAENMPCSKMQSSKIYETLISIKRAGADIIITYFAKYIAEKLKG